MTIIKWKSQGVFERERSYILFGSNKDKYPQVLPKSVLLDVKKDDDGWSFNCPDWLIEKEFEEVLGENRMKNIYGDRFNKMKKMRNCTSIEKV